MLDRSSKEYLDRSFLKLITLNCMELFHKDCYSFIYNIHYVIVFIGSYRIAYGNMLYSLSEKNEGLVNNYLYYELYQP